MELGIPVVIAVNMMDAVRKSGDQIHIQQLAESLGCEVAAVSALKGDGIREAADKAVQAAQTGAASPVHEFSFEVEEIIRDIESRLTGVPEEQKRFCAVKLFERDDKICEQITQAPDITEIIERAEKELDDDAESIITNERYNYISSVIDKCLQKAEKEKLTTSDRIDRIVTNRWLALPIFAAVMWLVYYVSVSTVGSIATDWTNDVLFGEIIPPAIENVLVNINCADWLQGLILDGIVGGVGAVLGYVAGLQKSIAQDNLVEMRRHREPERYLESFRDCAERVRQALESAEPNLFTVAAEESDELDMDMTM